MPESSTPIQANYPVPADFIVLAKQWCHNATDILLGYVWQGFDKLTDEEFDVSPENQNLEDDITFAAYCRIQDTMPPFSPYQVIHQPPEHEHRKPLGQSPKSDLGFRLRSGNVRSHFTIEAKVIRTDGAVSKYVAEVTTNLLTGRYSTFSTEAAMLGYLLSGRPDNTFKSVSNSLKCPLHPYPPFKHRNHRYSDHDHRTETVQSVSSAFRCHHMIMTFSAAASQAVN